MEMRTGVPFVGDSGQELDGTYLPLAGLRRGDLRVTNAVRCWAENNRTPSDKEIRECARHHLPGELAATAPEVVILMGASACSLVPEIRLEMHHGVPRRADMFGWEGIVVPQYHPAIGLHETRWMSTLLEDWRELGRILGSGVWPEDPQPKPVHYELLRGELNGMHPRLAVDRESHGSRPWSIQWSGVAGTAYMLLADDRRGIGKFAAWVDEEQPEVIFHEATGDLAELERLGVRITRYRDTLQETFHLGNLPQGLKPLAYRLFRYTMTSYDEVVRPASIGALQEWLGEALLVAHMDLGRMKTVVRKTCVCGHREDSHLTFAHARKCPCVEYRPAEVEVEEAGDVERLLNRLIRHTDVHEEYDPWSRLDEWRRAGDGYGHIEARCGTHPILGIANCKIDDAVRYACGDADLTLRVAVELERRRKDAFQIRDEDKDQ